MIAQHSLDLIPLPKGIYLRKVAVSSTMGVGVRVDASTIALQAQN